MLSVFKTFTKRTKKRIEILMSHSKIGIFSFQNLQLICSNGFSSQTSSYPTLLRISEYSSNLTIFIISKRQRERRTRLKLSSKWFSIKNYLLKKLSLFTIIKITTNIKKNISSELNKVRMPKLMHRLKEKVSKTLNCLILEINCNKMEKEKLKSIILRQLLKVTKINMRAFPQ